MHPQTSHHLYPPFSSSVTTAPLVSLSLPLLEAKDPSECSRFFEAAQRLGFFYLDMMGSKLGERVVDNCERLKAVQDDFYNLPVPVREEFAVGKVDEFFGYRRKVFQNQDSDMPKIAESYNMRKDDLIGNSPNPVARPKLIEDNLPLLAQYTRDCRAIIDLLLSILDEHLGLAPGTLYSLHKLDSKSGDHVRFNRTSRAKFDIDRARSGEHTDFGTLTILFNWLGGLQIRLPEGTEGVKGEKGESESNGDGGHGPTQGDAVNGGEGVDGSRVRSTALTCEGGERESAEFDEATSNRWVWVKPLPGKAIINLGDALVIFTAGILRSNVHRVVPPPPPQNHVDHRDSLVYFSRPEDEVRLKRLKGGLIDRQPYHQREAKGTGVDDQGIRSDEWILRRAQGDLVGVYTHDGGLEKRDYYKGATVSY